LALRVLAPDRDRAHERLGILRRVLLEKGFPADAVGEAREHQGPIGEIGQHPLGYGPVVLDQVALGVALVGPEDFGEVGKPYCVVRGGWFFLMRTGVNHGPLTTPFDYALRNRLVVSES